jgi:hypothetical protein
MVNNRFSRAILFAFGYSRSVRFEPLPDIVLMLTLTILWMWRYSWEIRLMLEHLSNHTNEGTACSSPTLLELER